LAISFGFKFGVPQSLDLLFDARFLQNPYFVPALKDLGGTDPRVYDFVMMHEETLEFLGHLRTLLDFLIPRYIKEGRTYLAIGIGCTGGRHRSPVIVEELARYFKEVHNISINLIHRDLE
jgi:UPF0042 nucleotide-binding protein